MFRRHLQMSLFDRLRRASLLRAVLVIAAVLASQNSLACAFEVFAGAQGTERADVAAEVRNPDASDAALQDDCCAFCVDCAHCGACHSSAVSPRASTTHAAIVAIDGTRIALAAAAPPLWTPPALLRPPIDAA